MFEDAEAVMKDIPEIQGRRKEDYERVEQEEEQDARKGKEKQQKENEVKRRI